MVELFCTFFIVVSLKDGSYCRHDIRQQNKLLKPKVVMLAIALQFVMNHFTLEITESTRQFQDFLRLRFHSLCKSAHGISMSNVPARNIPECVVAGRKSFTHLCR